MEFSLCDCDLFANLGALRLDATAKAMLPENILHTEGKWIINYPVLLVI